MPFQILRDDITRVKADVIVNSANPMPIYAYGTDAAIYEAAGAKELLKAREAIGVLAPGEVAVTEAFRLPSKYILHTVGPVWVDGKQGEAETLRTCYQRTLQKAKELQAQSVALPLISSGVYGFPKEEAFQIALEEIQRFLLGEDLWVTLVVFDKKAVQLSTRLMGSIKEYIDEHGAEQIRFGEYLFGAERFGGIGGLRPREEARWKEARWSPAREKASRPKRGKGEREEVRPPQSGKAESLDQVLDSVQKTFQERLFELIDAKGLDDVTVYRRANIDRRLFSRIRSNRDYVPKKATALSFAIALELDKDTAQDLLSRAGLAFSPSSKRDLIVSYFIDNQIYDLYEIDAALFQYGEPTLSSKE